MSPGPPAAPPRSRDSGRLRVGPAFGSVSDFPCSVALDRGDRAGSRSHPVVPWRRGDSPESAEGIGRGRGGDERERAEARLAAHLPSPPPPSPPPSGLGSGSPPIWLRSGGLDSALAWARDFALPLATAGLVAVRDRCRPLPSSRPLRPPTGPAGRRRPWRPGCGAGRRRRPGRGGRRRAARGPRSGGSRRRSGPWPSRGRGVRPSPPCSR